MHSTCKFDINRRVVIAFQKTDDQILTSLVTNWHTLCRKLCQFPFMSNKVTELTFGDSEVESKEYEVSRHS